MPKEIGGKIFHSPEESEPVDPETLAKAEAAFAEWDKRVAAVPPENRVASTNPRINGRDDFDGTEYEQWAKDQWADDEKRHE